MKERQKSKATSVIIRAYRSADRNACRHLWRQLAEKHAEIYSDPEIAREGVEDFFDSHLKKVGSKRIWVATMGRRVVGLIGLIVSEESPEDGEIEPLVIHKDFRGRGVGRQMLYVAEDAAGRLGVKYITVRPVARNIEAVRFFRDAGLDKIGRIELFRDLKDRKWREGIELHGMAFEY